MECFLIPQLMPPYLLQMEKLSDRLFEKLHCFISRLHLKKAFLAKIFYLPRSSNILDILDILDILGTVYLIAPRCMKLAPLPIDFY